MPIHNDEKVEETLSSSYCLLLATCSTSSLSKIDTITQGEKDGFTHWIKLTCSKLYGIFNLFFKRLKEHL